MRNFSLLFTISLITFGVIFLGSCTQECPTPQILILTEDKANSKITYQWEGSEARLYDYEFKINNNVVSSGTTESAQITLDVAPVQPGINKLEFIVTAYCNIIKDNGGNPVIGPMTDSTISEPKRSDWVGEIASVAIVYPITNPEAQTIREQIVFFRWENSEDGHCAMNDSSFSKFDKTYFKTDKYTECLRGLCSDKDELIRCFDTIKHRVVDSVLIAKNASDLKLICADSSPSSCAYVKFMWEEDKFCNLEEDDFSDFDQQFFKKDNFCKCIEETCDSNAENIIGCLRENVHIRIREEDIDYVKCNNKDAYRDTKTGIRRSTPLPNPTSENPNI